MSTQTMLRAATTPSDETKRSEAIKFSNALIRNRTVLLAYAAVLADMSGTLADQTARINDFIQQKAKNGLADYQTDYETVLAVQQALQIYQLLYWNGFYDTKIIASDGSETDGPEFVIAATLDVDSPVHVSIGRDQVIAPEFKGLILEWKTSAVYDGEGKLVFNLVPSRTGDFQRSFTGTWRVPGGTTQTVVGVQNTNTDSTTQDEQKDALPPALQVLYPTISALSAVALIVGGIVGIAWIRKQWKAMDAEAAQREAEAQADPGNARLREQADAAGRARDEAQGLADQGAQQLRRRRPMLMDMSDEEFDDAVESVSDDEFEMDQLGDVARDLEAARAAQAAPELERAAAAQARETEAADLSGNESEEDGSSSVEDGALSDTTVEPVGE